MFSKITYKDNKIKEKYKEAYKEVESVAKLDTDKYKYNSAIKLNA